MEIRNRRLNWTLIVIAIIVALSALVYALWSVLWPWLVLAILIPTLSLSLLVTVLSCGYVVSRWNHLETRENIVSTPRIEMVDPALAFDHEVPAVTLADESAWMNAYLRLAYLAHCKGSYSFGTLKPYIVRNKREYWEWMKAQMLIKDACYEDKKYGTLLNMPYKKFAVSVRSGVIRLLPCPGKEPPTVLIWTQAENTVNTVSMVSIVNMPNNHQ
jgi:hypothetical protein